MDLQLAGRVALITGGSKGIGRAAAVELAREGASVVVAARRKDVLAQAVDSIRRESNNENVIGVPADVSKLDDIERFVTTAHDRFHGVDILVNNAGGGAAAPVESVTDDHWISDYTLKVLAAARTSRASIPYMKEAGGGRIINITAVGGKHPAASSAPSTINRAAGIALTKAMSKDLAPHGILVNTICIGLVRSEQIERAAATRFSDLPIDEALERMGQAVPLGRIGRADEVGALVAFLASARASFITGVAINADGGMSASV